MIFRRLFLFIVVAGSFLSSVCSCTVKEDRSGCPCWLQVRVQNKEVVSTPVGVIGWNGSGLFDESFSIVEYPDYYERIVEKGFLHVLGYSGVRSMTLDAGHSLVIEYGRECDSLYSCSLPVDATGEFADAPLMLRKQFATVYLDIRKSADDLRDYSFVVEGGVCGFDLLRHSPVEGAFRCEPSAVSGSSVAVFRVPRQKDDSLVLGLTYDAGQGAFAIDRYPLGRYIAALNYSWSSEDLQDIYIMLDIISGRINIGVDGWEPEIGFDLDRIEI